MNEVQPLSQAAEPPPPPPVEKPAPDPTVTLAMAERAIELLQEDSERPTIATALALMEQIRDFLISQQQKEK